MAYSAADHNALHIVKSSLLQGGDCLGGLVSAEQVVSYTPLVIADEIDALEITRIGYSHQDSTTVPAYRYRDITIAYDGAEYTIACYGATSDPVTITTSGVLSVEVTAGVYCWAAVKVRRTPTAGTMTVRACPNYNNALGMADVQYGDTDYQYRCVFLWPTDDVTITNITVSAGLSYYYEGDQVISTSITDGATDPGFVWAGSGAVSLALTGGETYSFWLRSQPTGQGLQAVAMWITYTCNGESYTQRYTGLRRIPDASLAGYVLFAADDTETAVGTEAADSLTLPFTHAITPPVAGTEEYRLRVARRNQYNIESGNYLLDNTVVANTTGADTATPPAPTGLTLTAEPLGYCLAEWQYADVQGDSQAAEFVVAMTDGTTTLTETVRRTSASEYSVTIGPLAWGVVATVSVVSVDAAGNQSAADTDTVRLDADGDGSTLASVTTIATTASTTSYGNSNTDRTGTLTTMRGAGIVFWIEDTFGPVTVFTASDFSRTRDIFSFALVNQDLTGNAGADPIEVSGDKIYLCAGGKRAAEFDLTAGTLKAKAFSNVLNECPYDVAIYETADRTYFQIADVSDNAIRTWLAVDDQGIMYLPLGVTQT